MSEQKKPSFMEELDKWTEATVIDAMTYDFAEDDEERWKVTSVAVKKAIREKVLESYRNGQAAGPRPARKAGR